MPFMPVRLPFCADSARISADSTSGIDTCWLLTFFFLFHHRIPDTLLAPDWSSFPPKAQHRCATPSLLRKLYQTQRNVPAYRSLLRQNLTVFGTFDGTYVGLTGLSPFVFESGRFLIWTLYSPYTRPRLRLQQCRSYVSIPIRKWYGLRGFFGLGFLLAHVSACPSWTWSIWSQAF